MNLMGLGEAILRKRETSDSASFRAGAGSRMRGALKWTYEDKDQSFWGGVNYNRFPTPKITGQVKSVVGVAEVEQESSTRKGAGREDSARRNERWCILWRDISLNEIVIYS